MRRVALLAEGVDRNYLLHPAGATALVALLAEGVDRNGQSDELSVAVKRSPSSRRAWIEIDALPPDYHRAASPSSRRAWIEIALPCA
mgnify:CR=1 FL=1